MTKLPWFDFYPMDWLGDPALRRCSLAARGMWIDLLCLMFQCEERGVLSSGGVPWSDEEIAGAVGGDVGANLSVLHELVAKRVCSRNDAGCLFSRRLVRDEQIRKARQLSGSKGGSKTQSKRQANFKQNTEQICDCDCDCDCDFEKFWKEWPTLRRQGKGAARKAWERAIKKIPAEQLVAVAKEYAQSQEGQGQFVKQPSSWLNQECWNDDRAAWRKSDGRNQPARVGAGQRFSG